MKNLIINKIIKKKNNAYSLLELILTIAIASFLFTILATILTTVQKGTSSYYKLTHDDRKLSIISNYIFRDFSGAFVPAYNPEEPEKKSLLKDCFELKTDANKRLEKITFITNNKLPIYDSNNINIVKVIYKLEKSSDNLFKILRSKDMNLDSKDEPVFYKMIDNIKECLVKVYYQKEQLEDKKQDKNQDKKQDKEIIEDSNWSAAEIFKDKENKTQKKLLPEQISFGITTDFDNYFEIVVPIYGFETKPEEPIILSNQKTK
jgi:hypothetical protein